MVSFGTSYRETREKTIDMIQEDLGRAFPDRTLFAGWTSRMLVRKVAREEGLSVMTVEDAIERIGSEGFADVLVQPTHLTDGVENKRLRSLLEDSRGFQNISLGRPLLGGGEDLEKVASAVGEIFSFAGENEALVFMGHGSPGRKNGIYRELEDAVRAAGRKNAFIGTVEGPRGIEEIEEELKAAGITEVWLAPLMVVAGDHALNDMAGEDEASWKSFLEKRGYRCRTFPRGLGEFPEIRRIYAEHAAEARSITCR